MTTAHDQPPTARSQGAVIPRVTRREIFGWAMYDFANSSYTTVVITFIYSAFFVSYIVPESSAVKDSFWSVAIALSTLLSVLLAPLLGEIADSTGRKKDILVVLTLVSVLSTASLFFIDPGQVWLGIALLIGSNTAWMLSENFIASFLPEISTPGNIGKISGIGWGIGYIGGLLSLVLMLVIINADPKAEPQAYISQNQWAMVSVAAFYLVAALPTFILLKERGHPRAVCRNTSVMAVITHSLKRLTHVGTLAGQYPSLFRFFIPFTVYSAGIAIVVKFFGIYASQELGIAGGELIVAGAILQIAAMLGAIAFGFLQDRQGAEFTLYASLGWWVVGILAIYFIQPIAAVVAVDIRWVFIAIAFIAGSALGATQSASRAVVGLMSRPEDSALLYGLWGVFGKLAIVLGMIFGPIADAVGRHNALLVVILYFIAGALLLKLVPFNELAKHR